MKTSGLILLALLIMMPACKKDSGSGEYVDNPDDYIPSPFIIDHSCTDLSRIPQQWIDTVKQNLRVHYAHTSHGEQITVGLERLAAQDSRYAVEIASCQLPTRAQALNLLDGQVENGSCETYITPDLFWESPQGIAMTRWTLNHFNVNASGWAWCTQLDYYSDSQVQTYLDQMSQFESEFAGVRFFYFTGNAQSNEWNRYERNNQIRQFCRDQGRMLFDFGDLDCWYDGQQYRENGIPMEHPQYQGDDAGHANFASCENKARVFWWLMARLADWDGQTT